jgi:SAM-dependent methyltransferase
VLTDREVKSAGAGTRACPSCEARTVTSDRTAPLPPAEALSLDDVRPYWLGFHKERMFFTYRRCAACGMLYAPVYFSDEQLKTLYSAMAANMSVVDQKALDRTADEYYAVLSRSSPMRGTYLEIGPDAGAFAGICTSKGAFDNAILFEPNVAVHAHLRRAVSACPHELQEYFSAGKVADKSVDVAVMVHVLDHVVDPVSLAAEVRRTLRPGGCLFLVTHDERSWLARLLRGRWPAYCLQHPHLFNRRTMIQTLQRAGYTNIKTVASTNYFPVSFLIRQLLLAVKLPTPPIPELPWLRVGLRLGNFMTIARV